MTGSSPEGGRTAAAVASIACGAWPHAAAPSVAPPHNLRPTVAHTTAIGQPSVAQPCATISNRFATMRATIAAHQPQSRATICATDCATLIATTGHHRAIDRAKLTSTVRQAWRIHRQPAAQQLALDSGRVSREMRDVARAHARAAVGGGRRPWRRPVAFSKNFCLIQSENSRLDTIMATLVLKDPSHSSDTTVGELWRIRIPSPGSRTHQNPLSMLNTLSSVSMRKSRIQYLCDPQWFRDTASRGPTTIVAPESQFRTCPSDHGKSV
ncbi:hypothetical protein F511_28143 [Dorcoceras hygrometricum]|uniref:Uncharacterized protein n=1 Tax=Dorcoceras hygrometricum TaxID=472368 RepID=A0A2Z7CHL7_9LAMI|nr:hypothetical protein F511_28143 [Dorcoceras hygrometricum]